jgi:hypothetical protein
MKTTSIIFIILFLYLVVSLLVISSLIADLTITKESKEYYKSQMLTFCKINVIQNKFLRENTDLPTINLSENCSIWIPSYDLK